MMVPCLLRLIRLCGHESLSRHTYSHNTLLPSHTWNSCASPDHVCRDLEMGAGVYSNEALICGHGAKTRKWGLRVWPRCAGVNIKNMMSYMLISTFTFRSSGAQDDFTLYTQQNDMNTRSNDASRSTKIAHHSVAPS